MCSPFLPVHVKAAPQRAIVAEWGGDGSRPTLSRRRVAGGPPSRIRRMSAAQTRPWSCSGHRPAGVARGPPSGYLWGGSMRACRRRRRTRRRSRRRRLRQRRPRSASGSGQGARRSWSAVRLRLTGEELLEDALQFRDVDGCHLPHDLEIHTSVVVREHVPHAPHPAIRQLGDRLARLVGQVQRCLTDDLDASDDGVLPLRVATEGTLIRAGDLRADEPGRECPEGVQPDQRPYNCTAVARMCSLAKPLGDWSNA